ncbi:RNI-like protein [Amylostereum chailletii]|nr:RNI-like protein [Amylostereum chailletii]
MSIDSRIVDLRGRKLRLDTRADIEQHLKGIDVGVVEEIYLAENTFGVEAAQALGELLHRMNRLKVAGLSDIFITRLIEEIPHALTFICAGIQNLSSLVEVDLSNNALGGRAAHPLVPLIVQNNNIQVLKLNNCGLGPEGGAVIANALLESARRSEAEGRPSSLRVLICGRNRLEDGSAHAWGAALAAHTNLQKVKMVNNGIREAGFGAIIRGLTHCPDLRYLGLRDNNSMDIADDDGEDGAASSRERGWSPLATLLQTAPNLEFLDLSDCGLKIPGSTALIRALSSGRQANLATLLLENNDMDEGVYRSLSTAVLNHLPALTTLSLAWNEDLDGEALAAVTEELGKRGGRLVLDDEHEDDLEENGKDMVKETVFVGRQPLGWSGVNDLVADLFGLKVKG